VVVKEYYQVKNSKRFAAWKMGRWCRYGRQ